MDRSNSSGSAECSPSKRKNHSHSDDINSTKPRSSKSITSSSSHDGHREHRRKSEHKKVHGRGSYKEMDKDRTNGRERRQEKESRNTLREEQQSTRHAYSYNATEPPYVDSNQRPSVGMVPNYHAPYGLYAAMNPPHWGMTPLDAMNGVNVNATTGMSVNPNMDVNSFPYMSMAGDPNLYGMMPMGNCGQFGMLNSEGNAVITATKQVVRLSKCVLYPPNQNVPPPKINKPVGCKTVFVGGIPENMTQEIIKEVFDQCGEVIVVRMGSKNFCHIRFSSEEHADNALYFSGYRVKINDDNDPANNDRLHVDYARNDKHEYERYLEREALYRGFESSCSRPSTPVVRYSEQEAIALGEKLKNKDTFSEATIVLINWLEKGECNKRNSGCFYSLVQNTNGHVRILMNKKLKAEEELGVAKLKAQQRLSNILLQLNHITKVFNASSLKKVWDHFTKAQRKNIELWKKKLEEIKGAVVDEVISDRVEDEMEVSDTEGDASSKDGNKNDVTYEEKLKKFKALSEEVELLKSGLAIRQNAVNVLRALKKDCERNNRADHGQNELTQKHAKDEANLRDVRSCKLVQPDVEVKVLGECSNRDGGDTAGLNDSAKNDYVVVLRDGQGSSTSTTPVTIIVHRITCEESCLLGIILSFLFVHPDGASVDYTSSYLHELGFEMEARDVEAFMKRFPSGFREVSTGVGASLSKKWLFAPNCERM